MFYRNACFSGVFLPSSLWLQSPETEHPNPQSDPGAKPRAAWADGGGRGGAFLGRFGPSPVRPGHAIRGPGIPSQEGQVSSRKLDGPSMAIPDDSIEHPGPVSRA